ncbi:MULTISPECIES: hypothetical protein [Symbiopectobacterium]|uniref:hypothetical protein n=1 Tax=Symbiopectobacterium TaxID=801 RepID=UPI001A2E1B56|nr:MULTISPECIES: hypothetical protein [Symbiopectobacterium]MBG6249429.1 hypothetical protein [Candidatus Symbiopectobacterium sp. PLON1]MBT9428982.1 hypothetical protein [Candidatus Symbiopectobacterium endolongispinus]
MKKSALIIYMLMILTGSIGILFYMKSARTPTPGTSEMRGNSLTETIVVAVAQRDLSANNVLKKEDFQLKNISVSPESTDMQFNIKENDLIHWALKSAVAKGTYLQPTALVEGSDDYIAMFIMPGNVLYPFELDVSDNYLLTNLKPGASVDIYLSYGLRQDDNGSEDIISPAKSIRDTRLKPLMINRRVLAIRRVNQDEKEKSQESRSQLLVELRDAEIKLLKRLEGNARILLFPTARNPIDLRSRGSETLSGKEAIWPVSSAPPLFDEPRSRPTHEWRG